MKRYIKKFIVCLLAGIMGTIPGFAQESDQKENLLANAISTSESAADSGEAFYKVWRLHDRNGTEYTQNNFYHSCFSYITEANQYWCSALWKGEKHRLYSLNDNNAFAVDTPLAVLDYNYHGLADPEMVYSVPVTVPEEGDYTFTAHIAILDKFADYSKNPSDQSLISPINKQRLMVVIPEEEPQVKRVNWADDNLIVYNKETEETIPSSFNAIKMDDGRSNQHVSMKLHLLPTHKYISLMLPISTWAIADPKLLNDDDKGDPTLANPIMTAESSVTDIYGMDGIYRGTDTDTLEDGIYIIIRDGRISKQIIRK